MELLHERRVKNEKSTISKFFVNDDFECYLLEDKDRGLSSKQTLAKIKELKVYGKTAIPTGRYRVKRTFSNRFKRILPEIENVPGFSGIRIHSGNHSGNTEGCLLTGTWDGKAADWISGSRVAFDKLDAKLAAAEKRGEEIWITITEKYQTSGAETLAFQRLLSAADLYQDQLAMVA